MLHSRKKIVSRKFVFDQRRTHRFPNGRPIRTSQNLALFVNDRHFTDLRKKHRIDRHALNLSNRSIVHEHFKRVMQRVGNGITSSSSRMPARSSARRSTKWVVVHRSTATRFPIRSFRCPIPSRATIPSAPAEESSAMILRKSAPWSSARTMSSYSGFVLHHFAVDSNPLFAKDV